MPYHQRHGRYNRNKKRQLRFRMGLLSAVGKKPLRALQTFFVSIAGANFQVLAVTAGNTGVWDITNWSDPTTGVGDHDLSLLSTAATHPSEHETAVALGYTTSRVMSSMYRFDIRFAGTDLATKDFIFAYKFANVSTNSLVWTAGVTTIDNWVDIRQSRGWVWKKFSASSAGGSVWPSAARVEVKIPSVYALVKNMQLAIGDEVDINDLRCVINDTARTTAAQTAFLHVAIFTMDGTAFAAGDVRFDMDLFQRVKLMNEVDGGELVEEADQVG